MSPTLNGASRTVALANGRDVGIAEYGAPDGRPVLALHGAPACRLMYAMADGPAAARGLRLIAPDRPGYGLSPAVAGQTLGSEAETMERLADALGLDRVAIVAVSGGSPYAAATAARMGTRVSALALVSPLGPVADPAVAPRLGSMQRRIFLDLPRRRWLLRGGAQLARRVLLAAPGRAIAVASRLAGPADRAALADEPARAALIAMTGEAMRTGCEGGVTDMSVYAEPWAIDLARITAPAVVWIGLADRIVPVVAAQALAQGIPGCRLVTLPRAGHFWVIGHAEEVLAVLARML